MQKTRTVRCRRPYYKRSHTELNHMNRPLIVFALWQNYLTRSHPKKASSLTRGLQVVKIVKFSTAPGCVTAQFMLSSFSHSAHRHKSYKTHKVITFFQFKIIKKQGIQDIDA